MSIEDLNKEQLLEIVRRLPVTADGVPVFDGMTVYASTIRNIAMVPHADDIAHGVVKLYQHGYSVVTSEAACRRVEDCYSTREAAEAAR